MYPLATYLLIAILLIFSALFFYRQVFFHVILKRYKIKKKIIVSFLLIFLIMVFFVGLIIFLFSYSAIADEISRHLSSIASSRSDHLETYFNQNIERLKLITSRTALRNNLASYNESFKPEDLASMAGILKDAKEPVKDLERICIIGLEGRVLASTDQSFPAKNYYNEDFFLRSREKEGVYFVKENNVYKIFVSGPIILNNELIGVGLVVAPLDTLIEIIKDKIGLGETGEVLVGFHDSEGVRAYPIPRLFEANVVSLSDEKEGTAEPMKQALLGKETFFFRSLDYRNKTVLAATSYIGTANLGLVAKIDYDEAFIGVRNLFLVYLLVILIFFFIYYLISSYIADVLVKPLKIIFTEAKKIEGGNLNYKADIKGDDEIAELSRSFGYVVARVKKSRREIEETVENQTKKIKANSEKIANQQKALMNVMEDLQAEKKQIEDLAVDLEKFKLAVDNASDHIVITDGEGVILYANKAATRITGFKLNEMLGKKAGNKKLWGGLMDKGFYVKMWKTIKIDKKAIITEINNRRKNGEDYVARASISPILNASGGVEFFVGIERDITKEKQIDKAKTEFVSLASHQLRTPLTAINWYAEMLLSGDAGKIGAEQQEYLSEIYKGNQRMVELVNSLLNVSRIELGTFMVEPTDTDLNNLAEIAIKELRPLIERKKIKFSFRYDKKIPILKLDERLIGIVLQNLLSNAVKYTPNAGQVTLNVGLDKGGILISVKDTGYGIPLDQQDKIYQKLFRADNVKKTDTEGTGLGLYIVKSIIDQAKGKTWFKSKENKGTEFFVWLPKTGMKAKAGSKSLN